MLNIKDEKERRGGKNLFFAKAFLKLSGVGTLHRAANLWMLQKL